MFKSILKKATLTAASLTFSAFTAASAQAMSYYEVPLIDVANFTVISNLGNAIDSYDNQGVNPITFRSVKFIVDYESGIGSADTVIGATDLNLDLTGYDGIKLTLTNINESFWHFALGASDGSTEISTALSSLNVGETHTFLLDFPMIGFDIADVDIISLKISDSLPRPAGGSYDDYTAEFRVITSEPTILGLLGMGLLGVAGYRQLLRKK